MTHDKKFEMEGRLCVVTGATGGIGFETACGIAESRGTVVIVGRSEDKCRSAMNGIREMSGNPAVDYVVADLSLQSELRRLAQELQHR